MFYTQFVLALLLHSIMNGLIKHIVLTILLLLGIASQISALDHIQTLERNSTVEEQFHSSYFENVFKHDQINNSQNSSNFNIIEFNKEEEEDKHLLVKDVVKFYSFILAFILSQQNSSSILNEDVTVHFNEINTYSSTGRCVLLQVFTI